MSEHVVTYTVAPAEGDDDEDNMDYIPEREIASCTCGWAFDVRGLRWAPRVLGRQHEEGKL